MTQKLIGLLLCVAAMGKAEANRTAVNIAWFKDGTGLEFYTESTGNGAKVSSPGAVVVEGGPVVHRVVVDAGGTILFAYDVEARAAAPDAVDVLIKPVSVRFLNMVREEPHFIQGIGKSNGPMPTVAAVREFRAVRRGEAVMLDILYNPATGEKIYDVIRSASTPRPEPNVISSTVPLPDDEFSLRDITVRVNGREEKTRAGWLTGVAVRFYVPGHGAYVLSLRPVPGHVFQQTGRVEGKALGFVLGKNRIEVTSNTNLLMKAERATVWVFADPKFSVNAGADPDVVDIWAADSVEHLLTAK